MTSVTVNNEEESQCAFIARTVRQHPEQHCQRKHPADVAIVGPLQRIPEERSAGRRWQAQVNEDTLCPPRHPKRKTDANGRRRRRSMRNENAALRLENNQLKTENLELQGRLDSMQSQVTFLNDMILKLQDVILHSSDDLTNKSVQTSRTATTESVTTCASVNDDKRHNRSRKICKYSGRWSSLCVDSDDATSVASCVSQASILSASKSVKSLPREQELMAHHQED